MGPRDVSNAASGRRRFGGQGLEARNTQAARDALRRRQKEKKARIVKRHVRYKQKQKLLQQVELTERPAPIVATKLCRDDDDRFEDSDHHQINKARKAKSIVRNEDAEDKSCDKRSDENEEQTFCPKLAELGHLANRQNTVEEETKKRNEVSEKKKYIPFMKEQKEFQKLKEEREAQENERRRKIEKREQMLRKSKKERRAKAKKVRKVTPRGQPKLKYRLDAMLARIEKQ